MKIILPILSVIILLLVVGSTAFYFGQKSLVSNKIITPTPTPAWQSSLGGALASPSITLAFRTVPAGGVLTYSAYTISIPTDWTYTKQDGQNLDTLIIYKGENKLQIFQGATGGATCLYPGDINVEGPSTRFATFKDIKTLNGTLLRRGIDSTQDYVGVCEKQKTAFEEPTSFGHITYLTPGVTPSAELLLAMDSMVASLRKK